MNETPSAEHERPPRQARPRIWIGSLADYNNGRLHGVWVDAAQDDTDLYATAQGVLRTSDEPAAEEFAIFDDEDFGAYRVGEHESLTEVAVVARGIAEHGLAFAAWAELVRDQPSRLDEFADAYIGHYTSVEEWVRTMLDDLGVDAALAKAAPTLVAYVRVDTAGLARDMQLSGDIHVEEADEGGVWIYQGAS